MNSKRHDDGRDPDRNVDIEKPAPGITVGDPAAEHGTKHGSNDDAQRPECHGFGALLRRESFHQDGLREWLQTSAGCALEHAEDDQQRQVRSNAAEKREKRESAYGHQQNVAAAKVIAQPSGKRQHNGVGNKIRSQDPGCLFRGNGKAAGNMLQRYVHHRGVQHLHKGAKHHRNGDDPRIDCWLGVPSLKLRQRFKKVRSASFCCSPFASRSAALVNGLLSCQLLAAIC